MINPKRYTLKGQQGTATEHPSGDFVSYESYLELMAYAIEGAAEGAAAQKSNPLLREALVNILVSAASGKANMAAVLDIAKNALSS